MNIKDIIRTDRDRLFIVDYESYVLYTGESLDDDKPFIRIGSWMDMPVALIPLTENIIITDEITGNPAFEQFNIDLRLLKSNRYIGSKNAVSRFLNYQKVFNLDLKNASIVEIERDIPELSREKNISEKNQFIGVFYSNGNFKTVHGGRTIFDLTELRDKTVTISDIHDKIASKVTSDPGDTGFAVIDRNPIFFSGGRSVAYLFPLHYYSSFMDYGIDPAGITDIIYPSLNMINLAGFMKWKNKTGGKITLYSDYPDRIALTKKLFSECEIRAKSFTGMKFSSGSSLSVSAYPGTFNVMIEFSPAEGNKSVRAAYIKGSTGADEIIKEKPDLLIIAYSAYEDLTMLLKSASSPVAVIDDGNENASRLAGLNPIVLSEGRYSVRRIDSVEELALSAALPDHLMDIITAAPDRIFNEITDSSADGDEKIIQLINAAAVISAYMNNTPDRKLYSLYKSAFEKISGAVSPAKLKNSGLKLKSVLLLFNGRLYRTACAVEAKQVLCPDRIVDNPTFEISDRKISAFHEKVISDRKRLAALLEILKTNGTAIGLKDNDLQSLHDTISERKHSFLNTVHIIDSQNSDSIFSIRNSLPENGTHTDLQDVQTEKISPADSFAVKTNKLFKKHKVTLIITAAAAAAFLIFLTIMLTNKKTPAGGKPVTSGSITGPDITAADSPADVEKLKDKNIDVLESDIYHYANRIAELNGYSRIPMTDLQKKNPHWIFPGNVFMMHDNQKKTVQKGDTLWDISREKIAAVTIEFDSLMLKIQSEKNPAKKNELIQKAKTIAATRSQTKAAVELETGGIKK